MKSSIPFTLLFIFIALAGCQPSQKKYENRVGYIDPSTAFNDPSFKVCDENNIFDYYNINTNKDTPAGYQGGPKAIKKEILPKFNSNNYVPESGYLTIHFIINCKGETGRFEFVETDLDFKEKKFNDELKSRLLTLTRSLKDWNILFLEGSHHDSYMYLTYKFKDGEIIEILP